MTGQRPAVYPPRAASLFAPDAIVVCIAPGSLFPAAYLPLPLTATVTAILFGGRVTAGMSLANSDVSPDWPVAVALISV